MKAWNRLLFLLFGMFTFVFISVNIIMFQIKSKSLPNDYVVEINRMYQKLQTGVSLTDIEHEDIQVHMIAQDDLQLATYMHGSQTLILPAQSVDMFYVFSYPIEPLSMSFIMFMNIVFLLIFLFLLSVIFFLSRQIIRPFHQMEELADAMRNRDFTYPMPQSKYKFFGKFVWAIDVMKEELRYHEQKEWELMKEKKVMIASLSHDIKTPLSNIRLYSEASRETLYPLETIIQRIDENCDKIDQYIKDIVSTCKDDVFDFTIHPQSVYLHEILPILEREKERITLAMIAYKQDDFAYDRLISIDLYRLKEVVNNLVDNAIKYGDGKWIHISFYEEDHHPILCIENSGKRIDEKEGTAIFQSFYRGHNTNEQQGIGLGLYICKQLMLHMQGEIFMTQNDYSVSFHLVFEAL